MIGAVAAGLFTASSRTAVGGSHSSIVPQLHATPRIIILWSEQTRTAHTESRCFRFRTAKHFDGHDPNGVSQSFEQQLRAAGWEEPEADTSNNVFVSAWQRRDSEGRLIHAIFSIRQLSNPQEYFAAIEVLLP
jgi:hypothetical protein